MNAFDEDLDIALKDPVFARDFYLGLGAIKERERIIKLLVEQLDRLVSDSFEWNGIAGGEYREFDPNRFKGRLLALIGGKEA